ncbi:MAG TPA: ABC transporter permease, partial [Gemmatimonadaceae bacterium]
MVDRLIHLLKALFRRGRFEADMSDEMRFHMEAYAADLVRKGISPHQAARQAKLEFGPVEALREEGREAVGLRWFDELWRDVRCSFRQLARQPGFATIAIATLAIGIGVNAAMFGLIDSLLFRPPAHVADPTQVVRVKFVSDTAPGATPWYRQNYPAYRDLFASRAFESVAGYASASVSVGMGADAVEGKALIVTPSFFTTLGVRPFLGSLLSDADSLAQDRVVLSYGFWSRQFGSDPHTLGSKIMIGALPYTVIGVAPDGFTALQEERTDLWIPVGQMASPYLFRAWDTNRGSYWLDLVGRVPAGATPRTAEERAGVLLRRMRAEAGTNDSPVGVRTLPLIASRDSEKSREVQVSLWLAGVTAFVLLLACANVGNLVLARNITRRREYAVRLSLGASDWQLRRLLIADVIALAIPGLVMAMAVEYSVRHIVPAFLAGDVPIPQDVVDARAAVFLMASSAIAIAIVAAVSLLQV